MKLVFKKLHRKLVDEQHRLPLGLCFPLLVGELFFVNLDIEFPGQVSQGLRIGELLVLHDEVNSTTALATSKALAYALGWRHIERRVIVVVKRTQTYVVLAALLERDKIGDDIDDVGRIKYLIDCCKRMDITFQSSKRS